MPNEETASAPRRFLSLKWKALLLTSIPLIGLTVLFASLSHLNLVRQYNLQRRAAYEQHIVQVSGLIEQSSQRLQQLGSIILGLAGMQKPLALSNSASLVKAFNKHWHYLQIDMGIEMVRFYTKSNELLGSWGAPEIQRSIDSSVMGWIWQANDREQPVSFVLCKDNCIQFAIVPILAEGKSNGIILIARSMADVILGLKDVTGEETGIFLREDGGQDPGETSSIWDGRIVALTKSSEILPILKNIPASELNPQNMPRDVQVHHSNQSYDVSFIPLKKIIQGGDAYLIVVANITSDIARINQNLKQNFTAGAAGLFIFELLLLSLLWAPLSRLRRTTNILPLLSRSEFQQVRDAAKAPAHVFRVEDESDILTYNTISLSHQLEKLQQESTSHAQALAHRAEELTIQKEFISNLIHTAQAIIITQNNRGEITMMNQYGLSLLGYDEADLKGYPFSRLISRDDHSMDLYHELSDLSNGRLQNLRHELTVVCKDGSTREVAWYHSRPSGRDYADSSVLSVGHDITERKLAESRLSWLAEHDPLTGLYNRWRLQSVLEDAIAKAKVGGHTGALLYLDVDQFKDVNDSSGHQVGDSLIKEISGVLSRMVRESDFVARVGGDEFAIIIRDTNADGAIGLAKNIEKNLNQIILPISGTNHHVTASIGIALFPTHGDNMNDLLANSDLAMYKAKEGGRGCWYMFSNVEQIRERVQERVYWKTRLQTAVEEDHFLLYYQPILDIKRDTVKHFEVLLRLKEADGTLVLPGTFIGISEKIGMIHAIDRLVIKKSIAQLSTMVKQGHDLNFSVNLSAHAFNDPELYELIKSSLNESELDPSRLILEVTETAAVTDFSLARSCMTRIKDLGCRFALDDFGVGFSSFYCLKQLPVDYVKIDGSFIKNLDKNTDDQIMVKALAQVANGFGKESIAEFVGNEMTLALLREYGIGYGQGYMLGIPLPAEQAFSLLQKNAKLLRAV
jgi:diguanylate cyclase (GGDEF)-like protein/PAS domain S-box-containing protein